jgi:hypothetical protein
MNKDSKEKYIEIELKDHFQADISVILYCKFEEVGDNVVKYEIHYIYKREVWDGKMKISISKFINGIRELFQTDFKCFRYNYISEDEYRLGLIQ